MTRLNIQINYYPLIRKFQDFNGSANTKCLKNQLTKIVQSGGFIGELIHGVGQAFFKAGVEVFKRKVKGAIKDTVKEIAKNTLLIA